MVVRPIHHRHRDVGAGQSAGGIQTAETAANHHYAMLLARHELPSCRDGAYKSSVKWPSSRDALESDTRRVAPSTLLHYRNGGPPDPAIPAVQWNARRAAERGRSARLNRTGRRPVGWQPGHPASPTSVTGRPFSRAAASDPRGRPGTRETWRRKTTNATRVSTASARERGDHGQRRLRRGRVRLVPEPLIGRDAGALEYPGGQQRSDDQVAPRAPTPQPHRPDDHQRQPPGQVLDERRTGGQTHPPQERAGGRRRTGPERWCAARSASSAPR